jgi:hypothetical protein
MTIDLSTISYQELQQLATYTADNTLGSDIVYLKSLADPIILDGHVCCSLLIDKYGHAFLSTTAESGYFCALQKRTEHYYHSQTTAKLLGISPAPFCFGAMIYLRFGGRKQRSWLAFHEVVDFHEAPQHRVQCKCHTGISLILDEDYQGFKAQADQAVQLAKFRHYTIIAPLNVVPECFSHLQYASSWVWRHAHDDPDTLVIDGRPQPNAVTAFDFNTYTEQWLLTLFTQILKQTPALTEADDALMASVTQEVHQYLNKYQRE